MVRHNTGVYVSVIARTCVTPDPRVFVVKHLVLNLIYSICYACDSRTALLGLKAGTTTA